MKRYDRVEFEIMIDDWKKDHEDEMGDLEIGEITLAEDGWQAEVRDEKPTYVLTDDGTGNIRIDYVGTI